MKKMVATSEGAPRLWALLSQAWEQVELELQFPGAARFGHGERLPDEECSDEVPAARELSLRAELGASHVWLPAWAQVAGELP